VVLIPGDHDYYYDLAVKHDRVVHALWLAGACTNG
jgi:hypothetical protein